MVINIIKDNKSDSKQPVVYDLGTVTSTLQALLDNSRITITDKQVIILKVTQLDTSVSYYFLPFKDYNGNSVYGYGKEIVVSDLIPIGIDGGGGTPPNLGEVLTQGNRAPLAVNANRVFTLEDRTKNLYSLFDLSTTVSLTLNDSVAYDLGDVLKIQHYVGVDGSEVSTMNLVFDYVTVFYGNDLITSFSIPYGAVAYLEKILPSVWTLSYKLAQDIGGSGTVTSVSGTTDEITVSSPTTTPVIGISSNYTTARDAYADAKVEDNLTASTTVAPSKTAVLTEYDMITGLTFSGVFSLDKKGGRSYLPYTQTGSLTLSIGGSPIIGSFAVLRFTADGSAITGYAGWKLLSSDDITATNGVVHRVIVYQYEDEIWYSVKLN